VLRKGIERPSRRELTRRRELAHGLRWDTLSGNKADEIFGVVAVSLPA